MWNQVIAQKHLEDALNIVFKGEHIIVNARKDSSVSNLSGALLELDVWLPRLQLAFEFQDSYHYTTTWYNQDPLCDVQANDYKKTEAVRQLGITLISVPCWWDSLRESLVGDICFYRPDLLPYSSLSTALIPLNAPEVFFPENAVPGLGETMLASFTDSESFLSQTLDDIWWLGEKYDGIRCIWNPSRGHFFTRRGLVIPLPEKFVSRARKVTNILDGEIWHGRGFFVESQRILSPDIAEWSFLRLTVFDEPQPSTSEAFETRYFNLLKSFESDHPFFIVVARVMCKAQNFIKEWLRMVVDDGGEGIIFRKHGSTYVHGRSTNLIKIKESKRDAEALVLSVTKDQVQLQQANGGLFAVPMTHIDPTLILEIKEGLVVSFEYENYSRSETPVNPKITRIRKDVKWEEVVYDSGGDRLVKTSADFATKSPEWTVDHGINLRRYFEDFAKNKSHDPLIPDTWYSFSRKFYPLQKDLSTAFPHRGSYKKALVKIFPEIGLEERNFSPVPSNYWKDVKNRKAYLDSFASKNKFDPLVPDNWYHVAQTQLLKDSGILNYYRGSLAKALMHIYPDIGLDESKFVTSARKREEKYLRHVISTLFPSYPIVYNARKATNIVSPTTGNLLEIDIWIPDLKIGFEYQDKHHFVSTWYSNNTLSEYQKVDSVKKPLMEAKGYTLITVPCWWDKRQESLIATIRQKRSDLLRNYAHVRCAPIRTVPPHRFFAVPKIPNIGELMLASFATDTAFDPTHWWTSEKYDGVRALWHHTSGILYSRWAKPILLPPKMAEHIPTLFLDGELWFGRGNFTEATKVTGPSPTSDWQDLRFAIFDHPEPLNFSTEPEKLDSLGESQLQDIENPVTEVEDNSREENGVKNVLSNLSFVGRYKLLTSVPAQHPFIVLTSQIACSGLANIRSFVKAVLEGGGEGVVLRDGKARYQNGRSSSMVKFKAKRDNEAKINQVNGDGSYLCQLPNGTVFTCHLVDDGIQDELQEGMVISFQFNNITADGTPIKPIIYRIRYDLKWEDVLQRNTNIRTLEDITTGKKLMTPTAKPPESVKLPRPLGYWTKNDGANMRLFLDKFAKSRNHDPLNPNDWYSVKSYDLISAGGSGMLSHFESYIAALVSIYPEIHFEKEKFYGFSDWSTKAKRKSYFDKFAKSHGFEALVPKFWYSVPKRSYLQSADGKRVLSYYNGSHIKALKDIYPNPSTPWDERAFGHVNESSSNEDSSLLDPEKKSYGFWKEGGNLQKLAKLLERKLNIGADLDKWYSITNRHFDEHGFKHVIKQCGGLLSFLQRVYTNHAWQKWRFQAVNAGYWRDEKNLASFVNDLEQHFKIKQLPDWYSITTPQIYKIGGEYVLRKHGGLIALLKKVYPDHAWQFGKVRKT